METVHRTNTVCCFMVVLLFLTVASADQNLKTTFKEEVKYTPCGQVPSPLPSSPPPPSPPPASTGNFPPPSSPPSSGGGSGTYYSSLPLLSVSTYSPPPSASTGGGIGGMYYPPPIRGNHPTPPPPSPRLPRNYFPIDEDFPRNHTVPPPSTAAPPAVRSSIMLYAVAFLPLFLPLL